jgi:hypothetical protein
MADASACMSAHKVAQRDPVVCSSLGLVGMAANWRDAQRAEGRPWELRLCLPGAHMQADGRIAWCNESR